ncbi:MAG TPA: hypothetical protein VFR95_01790 [Gemmatimonadaceae bacterium]|nr:hypothetical protein [Gemmatimonadaceae bacterium]
MRLETRGVQLAMAPERLHEMEKKSSSIDSLSIVKSCASVALGRCVPADQVQG